MKTKLTLTVRKSVIDSAKKLAKRRKVSVSQLFEEAFSNEELTPIKTESQRAAQRLIERLSKAKSIETQGNDKDLLKEHVSRKFA
ncbi:MAG: DUF6364 family protein [Cyclobacteriaceae bacterium]